ncbi:MAG: GNAT family N-acyltransferase [Pseudomonadota bacterium]
MPSSETVSRDVPFELRLARSAQDRDGAARLRYRVFVEELGGSGEGVDHAAEFERDQFDDYVDHLILVDPTRNADRLDHVIGVYRVLRDDQMQALGRFYSEDEYDLIGLKASGRKLLELGRSCVHRDYRGGTAMFQLWQGLSDYVEAHGIEILFGVASFHGTRISDIAAPLSLLYHDHLAPEDIRPHSRAFESMNILSPDTFDRKEAMTQMPSLIKAYLRLGGVVGDGAFIDWDFNTVDVCLVMDTATLSARQRNIYAQARRRG